MKPTYYAQREGVDINGTRFGLGEKITGEHHPAVIHVLEGQGLISTNVPADSTMIPVDENAVEDMSRPELERAVIQRTKDVVAGRSDDELREAIKRMDAQAEDAADDNGAGDGSTGGTAYADLKDKPLNTLKTADLDTIAREEGVSFEGARNNPDRVKAIEEARASKAG